MNRYDVSVAWIPGPSTSIELGQTVTQPITITNGRQDLNVAIGQTYASVTFLKQDLFALIEGEGFSRSALTFGALLDIKVRTEGSTNAYERIFKGNITDISSDAYEITFQLVHEILYKCSGVAATTLVGPLSEPISSTIVYAFNATLGTIPVIANISSALDVYTTQPETEIQNPLPYLDSVLQQAASLFMFTDIDGDTLRLEQRPPQGIVTPTVIESDDVLLDYSIDRSVNEVTNYVSVVWGGGTYTAKNQTSIDRIGNRYQQVNTQLEDQPDAIALAFWNLGAKAPAGYPVVTFRTSAELLNLTAEQIALQIRPNQKLDLTAIWADGFDDYAYIEQVRHTIDRSQWRIELIISNADYSELTQTWSQVPPSVLWEDVLNDPNNFLSWDDLLYTNL